MDVTYAMTETMWAFLFTLGGALLAFIARLLYGFFRNRRLKRRYGVPEWYAAKSQNFLVEKDEVTGEETTREYDIKSVIQVTGQKGDRIWGEERSLVPQPVNDIHAGRVHTHRTWEFRAKVNRTQLSDRRIEGGYQAAQFQGIFLLDSNPDTDIFSGSWLGYTPNSQIQSGYYLWRPLFDFEPRRAEHDTPEHGYLALLRHGGYTGEPPAKAQFAVAMKTGESRNGRRRGNEVIGVVMYEFISTAETNELCENQCDEALKSTLRETPYGVIHWVTVEEEYRKKGVATRLLVEAMEHLHDMRASRAMVPPYQRDGNVTAVLQALGFFNADGTEWKDIRQRSSASADDGADPEPELESLKMHRLRELPELW